MAFQIVVTVVQIGTNPPLKVPTSMNFPISKSFLLSAAFGGSGISGANSTIVYDRQFYYASDSIPSVRAQIQAAGLSLIGMQEMAESGLTYAWAIDAVSSGSSGNSNVAKQMLTVAIGNSIAQYNWISVGNNLGADIHFSNLFTDAMYFKPTVSNSNLNDFGIYGYSGQTLTTILADLPANFFAPVKTAGIIPDLCIFHSLMENSISQGHSLALIQSQISGLITNVKNRWPGVIIHLVCPRVSTSYDTAAKVLIYQQLTAWYLSLDNGVDVYTTKTDQYQDPTHPGWPLPGFTDGIHPNSNAANMMGRDQAITLNRIAKRFKTNYACSSDNFALTGSVAASGTNVTGTKQANVTINGSANATIVALAEDPGLLLSYNVNAGSTNNLDIGSILLGYQTGLSLSQASTFVKLQIVSGAENIKFFSCSDGLTDGTGGTEVYVWRIVDGNAQTEGNWKNGDVIIFRSAIPVKARTGSITATGIYVYPRAKLAGGTFTFRVIAQGIGEV